MALRNNIHLRQERSLLKAFPCQYPMLRQGSSQLISREEGRPASPGQAGKWAGGVGTACVSVCSEPAGASGAPESGAALLCSHWAPRSWRDPRGDEVQLPPVTCAQAHPFSESGGPPGTAVLITPRGRLSRSENSVILNPMYYSE